MLDRLNTFRACQNHRSSQSYQLRLLVPRSLRDTPLRSVEKSESELSHKKAQKGTKEGRIETGNQLWVFVTFGASSWLKKSGKAEMSLEHAGPLEHV